jgi:hypothetical protein
MLAARSVEIPAWGDTRWLAVLALHHLHARGEPGLVALSLDALSATALAWPERGGKPYPVYQLSALMRFGFGDERPPRPRAAETWTPEQRRILTSVAGAMPPDQLVLFLANSRQALADHGLPDVSALRAILSLPAAPSVTVLDRRLEPSGPTLIERWAELEAAAEPDASRMLVELADALRPQDLLELFERLLGTRRQPNASERSLELMLQCAHHAAENADWPHAVSSRAAAIIEQGQYNGVSVVGARRICQLFAVLLVRSARARGTPASERVEELLEAQDVAESYTELSGLLRETLLSLPRPRRDDAVDALTIHSHHEPDDGWALFDLVPSASHTEKLLGLLDEWPELFVGATAFRAVEVLVAQGEAGLESLSAALADPACAHRHFAAAALAHLREVDRAELFGRYADDGDLRVWSIAAWALANDSSPTPAVLAAAGFDAAGEGPPSHGGVIGRDGRMWDGTPWR